jgi:hypothetical protein
MKSFVRGNPPAKPALCTYDAARNLMRRRLNAMRGSLVEESFVEQKGSLLGGLPHEAVFAEPPGAVAESSESLPEDDMLRRSKEAKPEHPHPLSGLTGIVKRS